MTERLPPLTALAYFESAARHGSFTSAAKELQTTQPAVSQRIGQLEADLGVALFLRQHRGVCLSEDGERLFNAVHDSLNAIRAVTARLRARRERGTLTIATDFGFASYWLMPRQTDLHERLPDTDVRIVTSQADVDPRHDTSDVAIAFGEGTWKECRQTKLFAEQVTPVCSPALWAAHQEFSRPEGLATAPLLHVQNSHPQRWLSWDDWFDAQRVGKSRSGREMTFNSYSLVIESARAGQGVALGWHPLVDSLLRSGQLVATTPLPVTTARGYYLLEPVHRPASDAVRVFRRWLLRQCEAVTVEQNRALKYPG